MRRMLTLGIEQPGRRLAAWCSGWGVITVAFAVGIGLGVLLASACAYFVVEHADRRHHG